ncbi:hypothetical protein UY3_11887 [Chelonia mydas]|uniref:Uncharacterized protein n=1 Tax=Chelonia mydas TaxID=8469 RepID=M7B1Q2_CHEMY|nr:hypothetical protein UY3_11887 [Chelonia mydas]
MLVKKTLCRLTVPLHQFYIAIVGPALIMTGPPSLSEYRVFSEKNEEDLWHLRDYQRFHPVPTTADTDWKLSKLTPFLVLTETATTIECVCGGNTLQYIKIVPWTPIQFLAVPRLLLQRFSLSAQYLALAVRLLILQMQSGVCVSGSSEVSTAVCGVLTKCSPSEASTPYIPPPFIGSLNVLKGLHLKRGILASIYVGELNEKDQASESRNQ